MIPARTKHLAKITAFLVGFLPAVASAQQFPQTLSANTVLGRTGIGPGPVQAITFVQLQAALTGAVGPIAANLVNAGPTSGSPASPTFRSLVGADLPVPSESTLGGVQSVTCASSNWFNTLSTAGALGCSQPNFTDLAGSIAAGQIPAAVVALTKLATQSNNTVVGNVSGGAASPIALTQTQLTALINTATASLSGALPAWPNNTTTYFRGDGTYVTHNCAALTDSSVGCSAARGQLPGETTTGSASGGNVGEYVESVIVSGSAVALTTATAKDVTTISLTAGDWDVFSQVDYLTPASTSITAIGASISGTANTLDTTAGKFAQIIMAAVVPGASSTLTQAIGPYRLSLSATTTIHMVALSTFTASTLSAYGIIRARRVR